MAQEKMKTTWLEQVQLNVRVPRELRRRFQRLVHRDEVTGAELLEKALQLYETWFGSVDETWRAARMRDDV